MAGRFLTARTIGFLCGAALFGYMNSLKYGAPAEDGVSRWGWPFPIWQNPGIMTGRRFFGWNLPLDAVAGLVISIGFGTLFGWVTRAKRRVDADVTVVMAISRARGIGCLFGVLLIAGLNIIQFISISLCRACYFEYGLPFLIWGQDGYVHRNFWVSTFAVLLIWATFSIGMGTVFDWAAGRMSRRSVKELS
jgi:hypothetical protein